MLTFGHTWRATQAALKPLAPAPREGRALVAHVLGMDDQTLLKAEQTPFPAHRIAALDALVARRLTGEPLAYVLGYAPFWGRDWHVSPSVLIPRPDTETLVHAVLNVLLPTATARIAEVGVGCGAIVGSILLERPHITAVGTDISPTALTTAAHNTTEAGIAHRLTLTSTNLLEGVEGLFDLILSNPPYISPAEYAALEPCVRTHEPREALLAENEGLAIYQALIPAAAPLLKPHGWLMLEIGPTQAAAVTALMIHHGYTAVSTLLDMAGRNRVVVGQRTGS